VSNARSPTSGFWIDHEPGFALGREHVPQMEVPVGQDGLLGGGREVAAEIDRLSEEPLVEGQILSNEPPGELVRQPRREIGDEGERVTLRNRSPQTPQQRGGDPDRLGAIGVVPEGGSGLQPFEQERAPSGFGVHESHGAVTVPQPQGVGFVLRLVVHEADLEHETFAGATLGRRDEPHGSARDRGTDGVTIDR
jgi:hypothetical protein